MEAGTSAPAEGLGASPGTSLLVPGSPGISRHRLLAFPSISQHLLAPCSIPWGARESLPCSPAMGWPQGASAPHFGGCLNARCREVAAFWTTDAPPAISSSQRGRCQPQPRACGTTRVMPAGPGQPIRKPPRIHPPARMLSRRLGDEPPAQDSRQSNAKFSMQIIS